MGGTVWEFQIDPNRVPEEIKNIIGTRRKKRNEKKSIEGDNKSSKKL